jgi:serine/threonine protein kinase
VEQLLRAVCDLNTLNVVHGDIKLENILLCECVGQPAAPMTPLSVIPILSLLFSEVVGW